MATSKTEAGKIKGGSYEPGPVNENQKIQIMLSHSVSIQIWQIFQCHAN